jgi:hypothetical protein
MSKFLPPRTQKSNTSSRFFLGVLGVLCSSLAFAVDTRETTTGMEAAIEGLILPGTELEVKPIEDRKSPLIVRIVEVSPHGSAFRYHLTYYALEPGTYDLRTALRRKDGSELADVPEIKVTVKALLPPGQILPNAIPPTPNPFFGGYRLAIVAAAALWFLGLLAIIFIGRKKKAEVERSVHSYSLADRLRPLVEQGLAGTLSLEQRADLERALLAYWKKRLNLEHEKPARVFQHLRQHAEAGPLLNQLELWLHKPGEQSPINVSKLLQPYQNLPADALQLAPERTAV